MAFLFYHIGGYFMSAGEFAAKQLKKIVNVIPNSVSNARIQREIAAMADPAGEVGVRGVVRDIGSVFNTATGGLTGQFMNWACKRSDGKAVAEEKKRQKARNGGRTKDVKAVVEAGLDSEKGLNSISKSYRKFGLDVGDVEQGDSGYDNYF